MTPSDLSRHLSTLPPDAPVRFVAEGAAFGPGTHVTEIRRHAVASLDCGGQRADWTEATLQLLDGTGGQPITASKLLGILTKAESALPDLGDAPLHVEGAPGNGPMIRFTPATPNLQDGEIRIALGGTQALCKPMARSGGCC